MPSLPSFFELLYDQAWGEAWLETEFTNPYKDRVFERILLTLSRRMPPCGERLLDIGANTGRFLHLAAKEGWRPEGVELNPRMAAFAAKKTGFQIYRQKAESLQSVYGRYSAVTLTDVLEHIPDPLLMLKNVQHLLKPEGWLAVTVPCGLNQLRKEKIRSYLRKDYRATIAENMVHVNHFSPGSLRLALERAGFTNVSIGVGPPSLQPWRGRDRARNTVDNLIRLSVYHLAQLPGGVSSPLALNLQAFAQKSG